MSEYGFGNMSYNGVPGSEGGFGDGQQGSEPQASQEPKWFRDRMEALAQQNRELADKVKSLTAEQDRAALSAQFEAAGVSPAAAALYQGDPSKVGEWLEANKALLAPAQAQQQQTGDAGQQAAGSAVPPPQQAAMQQMQNAGAGAGVVAPMGGDDELAAALRATTDADALVQIMQSKGWQYTRDNLNF